MNDAISLDRLLDAKIGLDKAKREYRAAILEARENGLSNGQIAEQLGVTEAAIRMWRKRNAR